MNHSALASLAAQTVTESFDVLLAADFEIAAIHKEHGRDIKLKADLFLSQEITRRLTNATNIRCLSEEEVLTHNFDHTEPVWIVDPLDGSMNFMRGLPLYCVSVALWKDRSPSIGVIYDIERKRTFSAHYAGGSIQNSDGHISPLHIGSTTDLGSAVLATGLPLLADTSADALGWMVEFMKRFKKIRMLGTAALSMAWVAEGRMDAYFERDIMLWDVAAGAALVQAAGGVYVMRPGRHPLSRDVLAANAPLATEMLKVLGW